MEGRQNEARWRSFCFVLKMAKRRGYITEDIPPLQNFVFPSPPEKIFKSEKRKILVMWISELTANTVPEVVKKMEEYQVKKTILIVEGKITPMALTSIRLLMAQSKKKEIEYFLFKETLYYVFEHNIVPEHEICSSEEKDVVLKSYEVIKDDMPKICATEAVCKILGAKKGDVLRITRPHDCIPQVGDEKIFSITYRVVV